MCGSPGGRLFATEGGCGVIPAFAERSGAGLGLGSGLRSPGGGWSPGGRREGRGSRGSAEGAGGPGRSRRAEDSGCGGVWWTRGGRERGARRPRGRKGPLARVRPHAARALGLGVRAALRRPSSAASGASPISPAATTAWRRLPPPSRMVLLLAGLGPGSTPPLPPALEPELRVPPAGRPVTGTEDLYRRPGCSSRSPADHVNLGL